MTECVFILILLFYYFFKHINSINLRPYLIGNWTLNSFLIDNNGIEKNLSQNEILEIKNEKSDFFIGIFFNDFKNCNLKFNFKSNSNISINYSLICLNFEIIDHLTLSIDEDNFITYFGKIKDFILSLNLLSFNFIQISLYNSKNGNIILYRLKKPYSKTFLDYIWILPLIITLIFLLYKKFNSNKNFKND